MECTPSVLTMLVVPNFGALEMLSAVPAIWDLDSNQSVTTHCAGECTTDIIRQPTTLAARWIVAVLWISQPVLYVCISILLLCRNLANCFIAYSQPHSAVGKQIVRWRYTSRYVVALNPYTQMVVSFCPLQRS
jgi:hypothetical protein